MTPKPAVVENFAQLTACPNQSKLLRRNVSRVVPQCINALAKIVAVWRIELRFSVEF
jgi:hypothetical protein